MNPGLPTAPGTWHDPSGGDPGQARCSVQTAVCPTSPYWLPWRTELHAAGVQYLLQAQMPARLHGCLSWAQQPAPRPLPLHTALPSMALCYISSFFSFFKNLICLKGRDAAFPSTGSLPICLGRAEARSPTWRRRPRGPSHHPGSHHRLPPQGAGTLPAAASSPCQRSACLPPLPRTGLCPPRESCVCTKRVPSWAVLREVWGSACSLLTKDAHSRHVTSARAFQGFHIPSHSFTCPTLQDTPSAPPRGSPSSPAVQAGAAVRAAGSCGLWRPLTVCRVQHAWGHSALPTAPLSKLTSPCSVIF